MFRRLSVTVVGLSFVFGVVVRGEDKPSATKQPAAAAKAAEKAPDGNSKEGESKGVDDEYYELYRVFAETMFQVEQNYVKDVDRRKLMEAAIRGLLDELDPYSNYI